VPSPTPPVNLRKLALVLVVLTGVGLFFGLDLGRFFGLRFIQDSLATLVAAQGLRIRCWPPCSIWRCTWG
jgi:hypothetical protein